MQTEGIVDAVGQERITLLARAYIEDMSPSNDQGIGWSIWLVVGVVVSLVSMVVVWQVRSRKPPSLAETKDSLVDYEPRVSMESQATAPTIYDALGSHLVSMFPSDVSSKAPESTYVE